MSATPSPDAYTDWLVMLFLVLAKVRREGLMAIESDVDSPETEGSIFGSMPQTSQQPYLEFATDVLRLMVGGNLNAGEMQVYADHAIAGYVESGVADTCLLKTIWLTLWASMNGYAPQVAIQFGRQAIPVPYKPSFFALEEKIKEAKRLQQERIEDDKKPVTLDEAIERFVESIGGKINASAE